jgi:ribonuclease III family protein
MNTDLHPRTLAFIGDAIFDVWIRTTLVQETHDINILHQRSVQCVRAECQADILREILPQLPEHLQDLARRARNVVTAPKGRKISQQAYRDASALEAIIGHCTLHEPDQLEFIKTLILQVVETLRHAADKTPSGRVE